MLEIIIKLLCKLTKGHYFTEHEWLDQKLKNYDCECDFNK